MTQRNDNPADPFKKALAEATKTMADDPDLTVTYSVDPPGMTADAMRLPQVSRRMTREEVLVARGTADALVPTASVAPTRARAETTSPAPSARVRRLRSRPMVHSPSNPR